MIEQIFKRLSNVLYNASNRPEAHTVDELLDQIKDACERYQEISGVDLRLKDNRE